MSAHHSHAHTASKQKAGSYFLLTAGVLFLLLLLIVGGLLLSRSDSGTEREDADRAAVRIKNLAELQAADTALLTTYGWSDQTKGVIHLPITRAMELILPELNAQSASASSSQPENPQR
jgi:hypothetical protein